MFVFCNGLTIKTSALSVNLLTYQIHCPLHARHFQIAREPIRQLVKECARGQVRPGIVHLAIPGICRILAAEDLLTPAVENADLKQVVAVDGYAVSIVEPVAIAGCKYVGYKQIQLNAYGLAHGIRAATAVGHQQANPEFTPAGIAVAYFDIL